MLSRTGRSIEIIHLVEKLHASGVSIVGLTNAREGVLGSEADFPIVVPLNFDHAISVNTYSSLALAAGVLASRTIGAYDVRLEEDLAGAFRASAVSIPQWREQIADSIWLTRDEDYYFLARGSSLGTAQEARLLWEEGVKSPAAAMGTGAFRHGPQEVIHKNMRFGMWLGAEKMRAQDLATAEDLQRLGASVMIIGQGELGDFAVLTLKIPQIAAGWQFLIDVFPAQLLAEHLSKLVGVDCDSFRLCSYVVEDEAGLLPVMEAAGSDDL